MAIAAKPTRKPEAITTDEDAAAAFIQGGGEKAKRPYYPPKKPRERQENVMVRFDAATLARIDAAADRVGLSRAAWLRLIVAERLDGPGA